MKVTFQKTIRDGSFDGYLAVTFDGDENILDVRQIIQVDHRPHNIKATVFKPSDTLWAFVLKNKNRILRPADDCERTKDGLPVRVSNSPSLSCIFPGAYTRQEYEYLVACSKKYGGFFFGIPQWAVEEEPGLAKFVKKRTNNEQI